MGLLEDLRHLAEQVKRRAVHIKGEEATKQALVLPFLQTLGYDVYDPSEVQPEYTADFAKKRGAGGLEKVDYAIHLGGNPAIFIECKAVHCAPEDHEGQIARYFNATPTVHAAIVTNGLCYRFFTDLAAVNVMDPSPFFEFDIQSFTERDVENLRSFTREGFNSAAIQACAEEMIYTERLSALVNDILRNPSESFTRFLLGELELVSGRVTARVVERFQPIVRKSVQTTLLDMMTRSIQQEIAVTKDSASPVENAVPAPQPPSGPPAEKVGGAQVVTTEEELDLFERVRRICADSSESSEVAYRDTTGYFGINLGRVGQWFIRAFLSGKKSLVLRLPVEQVAQLAPGFDVEAAPESVGKSRISISSVKDVERLRALVLVAYEDAVRRRASDAD